MFHGGVAFAGHLMWYMGSHELASSENGILLERGGNRRVVFFFRLHNQSNLLVLYLVDISLARPALATVLKDSDWGCNQYLSASQLYQPMSELNQNFKVIVQ